MGPQGGGNYRLMDDNSERPALLAHAARLCIYDGYLFIVFKIKIELNHYERSYRRLQSGKLGNAH